ncbi:MAG: isoleucine--tRNA ligase [Nanoarchaeota archaeon]
MQGYSPISTETEILEFWKKEKIYEKAKTKNKGKEKFYFLDGPPYTSGRIHIGQAWNKSLKDMIMRYKRIKGFDVFDRPGYDMHGLPTEHRAEEELGIKNKDEIQNFGVERFVEKCKEIAIMNMNLMNQDFIRLGVWMDFENAYQSILPEFIEGEWWLIKKADENNRLYLGKKTMHWCAKCGTALAKHELEYENVRDDSVFLKFQLTNKENEYLIVWTTTPWTLALNLGVMVNPDIDYIRAKVDDEIWIVAKALANVFITSVANKQFQILDEFKGEKLKGLKYIHPWFDEIQGFKEISSEKLHTVVLSTEYVDLSAGTGLVHLAPGCGPEDYEVGHREGLPPFNPLDEHGIFPKTTGRFAGLIAKKDDSKFIVLLGDSKIATTPVEHEYAHCWRCHKPVIFRTTSQWFFKIEDIKERMRELNKQVLWQPEWAGSNWFDSWIENLRDNGITRQRFWGTPLPIWRCNKCENYVVIGSLKELKELSGNIPKDLHKPWIDEITLKCVCGNVMYRIPDILDVWIDAGTTSWTALGYPQNKELFAKLWPADCIVEGKDQIRGWFNLLLIASMLSLNQHSYKAVYMHGFVQDALGRKMSKSLGNVISPYEVIDKYGADTLRYYMISSANPGVDINYNMEDMKTKNRNLIVLWNLHNYLIDLCRNYNIKIGELNINISNFGVEERYILSKLNSTIKRVTELMEHYKLDEVPNLCEDLFLELSRTYIQFIRERLSEEENVKVIVYTIAEVILGSLKLFSIIAPFVTEAIYLNLKEIFNLEEESIHLFSWPSYDENLIDKSLEENFDICKDIIQAILHAREITSLGVRWPLKEVIVVSKEEHIVKAMPVFSGVIKNYTNIKEIKVVRELEGIRLTLNADYEKISPDFNELTPIIIAKLTIESPESILSHIEKENKFTMKINDKEVNIVKEHIIVRRDVPPQYIESEFKTGFVYINRELSEELEAEGFAREIIRRVQSLRKKASLEKKDTINLLIKTDEELGRMLKPFYHHIKLRVNARTFKISELEPVKKIEFVSKEKIRGKEIIIYLEK